MKGTEKIVAHIQSSADKQADAIIAEAKLRCAEIRETYNVMAREAYSAKIRAGVKEWENKTNSSERIFRMDAKKNVLALKQKMVEASFAKAAEMIINMPEEDYSAFLAKIAAEAAAGSEEIILNEKDRRTVGEKVTAEANRRLNAEGKPGNLRLSDLTGTFTGGLVLQRGNIEINCTLEFMVTGIRSEIEAEVAAALFL